MNKFHLPPPATGLTTHRDAWHPWSQNMAQVVSLPSRINKIKSTVWGVCLLVSFPALCPLQLIPARLLADTKMWSAILFATYNVAPRLRIHAVQIVKNRPDKMCLTNRLNISLKFASFIQGRAPSLAHNWRHYAYGTPLAQSLPLLLLSWKTWPLTLAILYWEIMD